MIRDFCTYFIKLRGQGCSDEINLRSPIKLAVEHTEFDETLVSFDTDQAGLVGMMSYLHGLGFIFLSMTRVDRPE